MRMNVFYIIPQELHINGSHNENEGILRSMKGILKGNKGFIK